MGHLGVGRAWILFLLGSWDKARPSFGVGPLVVMETEQRND